MADRRDWSTIPSTVEELVESIDSCEKDVGGGGICDADNSQIVACQEPGSPYVDNEVFTMSFGKCPEVQSSRNLG